MSIFACFLGSSWTVQSAMECHGERGTSPGLISRFPKPNQERISKDFYESARELMGTAQ